MAEAPSAHKYNESSLAEACPDRESSSNLNRWFLDCLEVAFTLGEELGRGSQVDRPSIFTSTLSSVRRVLRLESVAFLEVNDACEFEITLADPPEAADAIDEEVSLAIDEGAFSWAISRNQAVVTPRKHSKKPALLHAISTRSKVFGMFFAGVDSSSPIFPEVELKILSILLHVCAAALETSELQSQLAQYSETLEDQLRDRTAEIERSREEALAASRATGNFLNLSGRALLSKIEGMKDVTDQLLESGSESPQQRKLEELGKNAIALLALANQILDFSSFEAGEVAIASEPFDLRATLEGVYARSIKSARAGGLELELSYSDDALPHMVGDAERILQIVLGLTGNAIAFTREGRVSIRVDWRTGGNERVDLRIAVADTGSGIPEEDLEAIFERFDSAEGPANGSQRGTALNLTALRRIAELMGGTLTVTSQLGSGSTFELALSLPLDRHEKSAKNTLRSEAPGRRVLVVEDDSVASKVAARILEKAGCIVDIAVDGIEAVDHFERSRYDLILMDLDLPKLNGFRATERIRAHERGRSRTPIVAVTATASEGGRNACTSAGMDDFISKPLKQDVLMSVVARWGLSSPSQASPSSKEQS